jgi:glutamate-5-semialdehyde dehydrogenase
MRTIGIAARQASRSLSSASNEQRNKALLNVAEEIRRRETSILDANARDIEKAEARGLGVAMLDRLRLDAGRIATIITSLETVAALPDPLGRVVDERHRPNGLVIQRISVPLGVIGIIYESRPNVTVDAASLCIKSGNTAILRGGSESQQSNAILYECLRVGLESADIDGDAVQWVPTTDRAAVGCMLSGMAEWIDVLIPRGGKSLVKRVQDEANIPVIGHLEGVCHVYIHGSANIDMASEVVVNAKMRRTGICGAAETLLIDQSVSAAARDQIIASLIDAGCEIRGDETIAAANPKIRKATSEDWSTEYLDAIISVREVDGVDEAIEHIARYGTGHTESIVASDRDAAEQFLERVDSAIVLHNASTQFADGGEFGMGAEIGIATGRIHARGPVGAEQLTSYKYIVRGHGQTRP